jgi:hypothetical protein
MATEIEKTRDFIVKLLKKNKALTEKQVKAAMGKAFKINPKEISAGIIRDVRKSLGIDRPGALSHARAMLEKEPLIEAKKVIKSVSDRFGIRLGPPDVSRMRPKSAKAGRKGGRPGRPPKAAARAKAAAAPKTAARSGRSRKAARATKRAGGRTGKGLEISVTFDGRGLPTALAEFFRNLRG